MEEKIIIQQIKKGDTEAFNRLLDIYESKVFGFINRMINDRHRAQDVTQETFIKVFKNISSYKSSKVFSTWLFTIAKNETFNYLRQLNKVKFVDMIESEDTKTNSIEEQYLIKEMYVEVCRIIDKLPKKYRDLIILKYFLGLSYKEISERMDFPIKKVESHIYLARKKIMKEFNRKKSMNKVVETWNVAEFESL